jgi:hypothetical protein
MVPVHSQDTILGSQVGFLFVRAVGDDGRGRAVGQALIHGEGLIGGREHLAHGGVHQVGQALSAEFLGHVDGGPAALLHLLEGVLEARRACRRCRFPAAALGVAHGVERGQHLGADLARFLQDGGGEVAVEVGVARIPAS